MIDLEFPDGSVRQFEEGATGRDVAASIAKSLEKRSALVKLDGVLLDLDRPLTPGLTYVVNIDKLNLRTPQVRFQWKPATTRSEAVHVNQIGFRPDLPGTGLRLRGTEPPPGEIVSPALRRRRPSA